MKSSTTPPGSAAHLIERLIFLTEKGQMHWARVYGSPAIGMDGADTVDAGRPVAYLLEDNIFGFGRVMLSLDREKTEAGGLFIAINGERLEDASKVDLSLLKDHIKLYHREIMTGRMRTVHDRMAHMVDRAVEDAQQEIDVHREFGQRLLGQVERQTGLLDKALSAVIGAQTIALTAQTAPAGSPDEDPDFMIELNAQALSRVLVILREAGKIQINSNITYAELDQVIEQLLQQGLAGEAHIE
jgi:hypothetical protein